jgi:hypothetical protein
MLIRILADNPGKTFTRNIDSKFVQVVKELLRVGRDPSVKQILMETLDTFSREKSGDDGLVMLNEMWKKEHERMIKLHVSNSTLCCTPSNYSRAKLDQQHPEHRTLLTSTPVNNSKTTSPEVTIQGSYPIRTNFPPASKKHELLPNCSPKSYNLPRPPNFYRMSSYASSQIAV